MRWLIVTSLALAAAVASPTAGGTAPGDPEAVCVSQEYADPDGSGGIVLQLCDGSYVQQPAGSRLEQYAECGPDGTVSLVTQWRDGWTYQPLPGQACPAARADGPHSVPLPRPTPAQDPSACRAEVTWDGFQGRAGSSTVFGRGRAYNPCPEALDVVIHLYGEAEPAGAPVVDAPAVYLPGLGAGQAKPLYVPIAEGQRAASFSTQHWSAPSGRRDERWCLAPDKCLTADLRLFGALAALESTGEGRQWLAVAQEQRITLDRGNLEGDLFGEWDPDNKILTISRQLDPYASEQAAALAHELRHVVDDLAGKPYAPAAQCLEREEDAYRQQVQFWTRFWGNKLPPDISSFHRAMNELTAASAGDPSAFHDIVVRLKAEACRQAR